MSGALGQLQRPYTFIRKPLTTGGALAKVAMVKLLSLVQVPVRWTFVRYEHVLAVREPVKPHLAASHHGMAVNCLGLDSPQAPAVRNRAPWCSGIMQAKADHRTAVMLCFRKNYF